MNNVFPLLDLPSNFLKNALSIMEILDIISFSFISNKTKSLVTAMKLNEFVLEIDVGESFEVVMSADETLNFSLCRENINNPVPLIMGGTVKVYHRHQAYNWRKEGYGVRDWIDHLMAVTRQSEVSTIQFEASGERFQLNSIKAVLRGLNIQTLSIHGDFPPPYLLDVVAAFPLKMLDMFVVQNPSPVELHSVFAQNFDALQMIHMPGLSVNELLIMNTKFMEIHLDEGEKLNLFNSFLKLWKTGFNRKLECLFIFYENRADEAVDVVLKGIKHQLIPRTLVRQFKRPAGVAEPEGMVEVAGGFDIRGIDGRKATIYVENGFCEMFFWSESRVFVI